MPKSSLDLYNRKRDFSKTAEPKGAAPKARRKAGALRYVIQKHAARRLHFDFRLEYDGVLKSWAVPKGPSLDPSIKRLAVETEDHPIEYGEFEGTIPRGEYGGGTVQLWDRGTWTPEDPDKVEKAFAKGHIAFELDGERLHGRWNLVRTSGRSYGGGGGGNEKGKAWLLIKGHDSYASDDDPDALANIDKSIKTGRSMVEIATGKSAVWRSNRSKAEDPIAKPKAARKTTRRTKAADMPAFIAPQLATLVDEAPDGAGWVHEIKLDGYRIQIHVNAGEAIAYTRKGLDWSDHFPEIVAAAAVLPDCILDGEIVALAEGGQSDFSALQASLEQNTTGKLIYYVFDLLYADGKDYRKEPLEARKAALKDLIGDKQTGRIRYVEHLDGAGETIRQSACDMELEGIVSKRLEARYASGRQQSWLKSKCRPRQEFVVGGYIRREGGNPLTALVVGAYEDGEFRYKGKVGTGYNADSSAKLLKLLAKLEQDTTPFSKTGAQPEKPREIDWVTPKLVVEVEFTSWTGSGVLRQASFKGLREDKPPSEVKVEKAKAGKTSKAAPQAASRPTVSNPDKLLWPEDGVTKQQLADYYDTFAEHLLPHVANRPISLIRAPDGIQGEQFFQRHHGRGMPEGIIPIKVRSEKQPYVMIKDRQGLRGLAQFGVVEIHPWGAPARNIEKPDQLIFDLDPDEGLSFTMIKRAAIGMRAHLENLGLAAFPKLTGGKGVHVVVPLQPHLEWDEAKAFTKEIAEAFERVDPANFVATMSKAKRKGRIFIDYLRNSRTATAVAAWSPRARPGAPIAVPVTWDFFSSLKSLPIYSLQRPDEVEQHFKAWKDFDKRRVKLTRAILKQVGL